MPPRAARKKNAATRVPPAASDTPVAGSSRLEQLPAEIIQKIFDLLWIDDESIQEDLMRPLSKQLLPFSTTALYRDIKVCNNLDLGRLASTLLGSSHHREIVQSLQFEYRREEEEQEVKGNYEELLERCVENLLQSLEGLKILEVSDWDLVGKVVLSGNLRGKEIRSIFFKNCFGTIVGPVSIVLNRLRHLPQLEKLVYHNPTRVMEASIEFQDIGFAKLTNLKVWTPFPSIPIATTSFHAINIASLFPAVVRLELIQSEIHEAPNFSPFLTTIKPDSIARLTINSDHTAEYDAAVDLYPIHQDLKRFTSLTQLHFLDRRAVSKELAIAICNTSDLTLLEFGENCKISFNCLEQLLSGIDETGSTIEHVIVVSLDMNIGKIGSSCQDGGLPIFQNGNLVPGIDWKRPTWKEDVMTKEQGVELEELAEKRGLVFYGTIGEALEVEEAFGKEERRLKDGMEVVRIGREAARVKWNAEDEVSSGEE